MELDDPPTMEELNAAIDQLRTGKAAGNDGICPELLKCGKPALMSHLHKLLCLCWEKGEVPQDMRDANIITLYKNKGDRSDTNNYRGISLLSIVGKAYARVVLKRLQVLASRVYPESQCGFRADRSTIDMVFCVRQLQEKCREQRMPLFMAFVDLTKAFDLVSRHGLFALLERIGCPPKLLGVIRSFHTNMKGTIQFNGSSSDAFEMNSGVKQGCVLAPTLFGIFFSLLLRSAFLDCPEGVLLHSRSDGSLFDVRRLKAKTKIHDVTVREMLFADDAALVSHSEAGLQHLVNCFASACDAFGLTISVKKTEVMAQGTDSPPSISIGENTLVNVSQFTNLGSTISSNLSLDAEMNRRIGRAAGTMSKLKKRVWDNKMLTLKTKMSIYQACVLSTLLYGSET